jgi:hypothetical protein
LFLCAFSGWSEQLIHRIGVGMLIRIRDDLRALLARLIFVALHSILDALHGTSSVATSRFVELIQYLDDLDIFVAGRRSMTRILLALRLLASILLVAGKGNLVC